MLTKNVHYAENPDKIIVLRNGNIAVVEMPTEVKEIELEDERTEYVAEKVYSVRTQNTPNLEERVEANYEEWLALAAEVEPQMATLEDVIDAVNALTEIVIGD